MAPATGMGTAIRYGDSSLALTTPNPPMNMALGDRPQWDRLPTAPVAVVVMAAAEALAGQVLLRAQGLWWRHQREEQQQEGFLQDGASAVPSPEGGERIGEPTHLPHPEHPSIVPLRVEALVWGAALLRGLQRLRVLWGAE